MQNSFRLHFVCVIFLVKLTYFVDMCTPSCENKGTCISPNMCLCLDGFYGKRCEKGNEAIFTIF